MLGENGGFFDTTHIDVVPEAELEWKQKAARALRQLAPVEDRSEFAAMLGLEEAI